ncbi:hypothetical protein OE88DRAFT_1734541 [Heliocybe sulcata]|uniref:Uncharacterized protein n=1 Tax=Heliocybe sulcata TaxID=5364 RepID=A0A5C3N564_9AGAM|nr:hypothetical protein OE88DRAFT_1734541 [Heliocybe sulcata]
MATARPLSPLSEHKFALRVISIRTCEDILNSEECTKLVRSWRSSPFIRRGGPVSRPLDAFALFRLFFPHREDQWNILPEEVKKPWIDSASTLQAVHKNILQDYAPSDTSLQSGSQERRIMLRTGSRPVTLTSVKPYGIGRASLRPYRRIRQRAPTSHPGDMHETLSCELLTKTMDTRCETGVMILPSASPDQACQRLDPSNTVDDRDVVVASPCTGAAATEDNEEVTASQSESQVLLDPSPMDSHEPTSGAPLTAVIKRSSGQHSTASSPDTGNEVSERQKLDDAAVGLGMLRAARDNRSHPSGTLPSS